MLAGDELRQVFLLLRLGAVAPDLVDAEVRVRAVGKPDRARGARDLLHRHDVSEVAHGRAAEFLLHRDAEQAERAELGPQLGREFVRAVDLGGARGDFLRREVAHRVAQDLEGLAMLESQEVHSGLSGRSGSAIRVCCMVATCLPSSAYTSARAIVSVRPGRITSPRATRELRAGVRMFILYSTV